VSVGCDEIHKICKGTPVSLGCDEIDKICTRAPVSLGCHAIQKSAKEPPCLCVLMQYRNLQSNTVFEFSFHPLFYFLFEPQTLLSTSNPKKQKKNTKKQKVVSPNGRKIHRHRHTHTLCTHTQRQKKKKTTKTKTLKLLLLSSLQKNTRA